MFLDQKMAKKKKIEQAIVIFLPALFVALLCLISCQSAAYATKHSAETQTFVKTQFAGAQLRIDGVMTLPDGSMYLPLFVEGNVPSTGKPVGIIDRYPRGVADKDVVTFVLDNGLIFVKVVPASEAGVTKTLPDVDKMPPNLNALMLKSRLPQDFIVPDGFAVSVNWKPVLGDLAIPISNSISVPAPAASTSTSTSGSALPAMPAQTIKKVVEPPHKAIANPNGAIFVSSPASGYLCLVDPVTYKKLGEMPVGGTPVCLANYRDSLLVLDQSKARILMLDPATQNKTGVGQIDLVARSAPKSMALVNDKLLYVSESAIAAVCVVDLEQGRILQHTRTVAGPARLAATPNGNTVLVLSPAAGQVSFISTLSHKYLASINVGDNPSFCTISGDSRIAYVSCKSANMIAVVDIAKRALIARIKTGNAPTGMVLSPDQTKLYVALAKDNAISIIDVATRAVVGEIKLPMDVDFPGGIALDASGERMVVTSAATPNIGIIDLAKGEVVAQPEIGRSSDDARFVIPNH